MLMDGAKFNSTVLVVTATEHPVGESRSRRFEATLRRVDDEDEEGEVAAGEAMLANLGLLRSAIRNVIPVSKMPLANSGG